MSSESTVVITTTAVLSRYQVRYCALAETPEAPGHGADRDHREDGQDPAQQVSHAAPPPARSPPEPTGVLSDGRPRTP
ncbi:MAG TPA: hypothetical protein VK935_10170 [Actinomycetospora sp.]|nr:hypothetical protein [Actinomycetospora sp.]